MHPHVVAALACPHDAAPVRLEERTLRCPRGHAFDLARQGYVNLRVGRDPGTGDDAAMVAARQEVLDAGRFAPVTHALAEAVAGAAPPDGVVVDLGAGTGHHLAGVLDALPAAGGVAVDLSVPAARRAARCHPRVGAVVADVWRGVPVRTGVAAAVLCVFAPRNATEIARILRPDGVLVVVTPAGHHLAELVAPLGLLSVDPRKAERLAATLGATTVPVGPVRAVERRFAVARDEARTLVAMGPSADHLDAAELDRRVAGLPGRLEVTLAVEVRTFRPR